MARGMCGPEDFSLRSPLARKTRIETPREVIRHPSFSNDSGAVSANKNYLESEFIEVGLIPDSGPKEW